MYIQYVCVCLYMFSMIICIIYNDNLIISYHYHIATVLQQTGFLLVLGVTLPPPGTGLRSLTLFLQSDVKRTEMSRTLMQSFLLCPLFFSVT